MKTFKNTLIQITRNGMGSGDIILAHQLIKNYLTLLAEEPELPNVITFYNEGVKLICKNSPVTEELKFLEQKGVKLVACKSCLNHYKLTNEIEMGIVATMVDILQLQKVADKVVNL